MLKKIYHKFSDGKLSQSHIDNFLQRLKTLLDAGITIAKALEIIASSEMKSGFQKIIEDIRIKIVQGKSLSEALKFHSGLFDQTSIQLISLGEKTSMLPLVLNHLIYYRNKTLEIKRQIKRTLIYPLLVLCVSIIIALFLMFHVAPNLASIYQNLNVQLPLATRIMMKVFEILTWFFPFILALILASVWKLKKLYLGRAQFRLKADQLLLKLPLIGNLIKKTNIAYALFSLYILVLVNLPVKRSLILVAESCSNHCYRNAWLWADREVKNGLALSQALAGPLFPPDLIQMLLIGEQSSALPQLLQQAYQSYQTELFDQMKQLTQFLEPISVLFLAGVVGTIIVVMYLPIFQLGNLF